MRRILCLSAWFLPLLLVCSLVGAEPPKGTALTGRWSGAYSYPEGSGMPAVEFSLILVQDGRNLSGVSKEPNTFGGGDNPFLHATLKGTYDEETRKFSYTKTYDGTSGISHEVMYSGKLSADGSRIDEAAWTIGDFGGSFTLAKDGMTTAGPYSGEWAGTNLSAEKKDEAPVKVTMFIVYRGKDLVGLIKERRPKDVEGDPWLHATITGTIDESSGQITLTKTYDGTAGVKTTETYTGQRQGEQKPVFRGARKMSGTDVGTFELLRAPKD